MKFISHRICMYQPFPRCQNFSPRLAAVLPSGWYGKSTLTLLAPDGQANVLFSSEPLDARMTSRDYAEVQGRLLRCEFPDFVEVEFSPARVFGGHCGFRREFGWKPPDGVPITQIQLYAVVDGRGLTATATSPSTLFDHQAETLLRVLSQLRIGADGVACTAAGRNGWRGTAK